MFYSLGWCIHSYKNLKINYEKKYFEHDNEYPNARNLNH